MIIPSNHRKGREQLLPVVREKDFRGILNIFFFSSLRVENNEIVDYLLSRDHRQHILS